MAKVGFIMNEQTEGQIVEPNIYIYINKNTFYIKGLFNAIHNLIHRYI